jgi:hypothetical protein
MVGVRETNANGLVDKKDVRILVPAVLPRGRARIIGDATGTYSNVSALTNLSMENPGVSVPSS